MAIKDRFEFKEFRGVDQHTVEGKNFAPVTLSNLKTNKGSGGFELANRSDVSVALNIGATYDLLAYDESGYATMIESDNDTKVIDSEGNIYTRSFGGDSEIWHLPGAGAGWLRDSAYSPVVGRESRVLLAAPGVTLTATGSNSAGEMGGHYWAAIYLGWYRTDTGRYNYVLDGFSSAVPARFDFSGDANAQITFGITGTLASGDDHYFEVYLARVTANEELPYALACVLRADNTSSVITDYPIGQTLPTPIGTGAGAPIPYVARAAFKDGLSVWHRGKVYGVPNEVADQFYVRNGIAGEDAQYRKLNSGIIYTESGTLNFMLQDNYIDNVLPSADSITGLASMDYGLMVFGNNSGALIYGDPDFIAAGRLSDFGKRPLPYVIGHDSAYPPARLGANLFVVWHGHVYAVNESSKQNISIPVDKTFIQVAADVINELIFALADDNTVWTFDIEDGQWYQLGIPQDYTALKPTYRSHGMEFYDDSGVFWKAGGGAIADTAATLTLNRLDCGDRWLTKTFEQVELFAPSNATITLTYSVFDSQGNEQTATITGVDKGDDRYLFDFPSGLNGQTLSLSFYFTGLSVGDVIRPPITVFFSHRYRKHS